MDGSPPVESRSKAPVEAWGAVLQKLVICKVNLDPLLQLCTLKEQTIFATYFDTRQ